MLRMVADGALTAQPFALRVVTDKRRAFAPFV